MKDSEKRLLSIFMALLVGAAVVVIFKLYQDKRRKLESERSDLELQVVEIDSLLENRDLWLARAEWLKRHQPPYTTREQVTNLIYQDANAENVQDVAVSNIQLIDEVVTPHYIQAGATLTATGTLEAVFRWLHQLQHPEEFRVVSDLRVQPDKDDDSKIVCKFALLRWYATN